MKLYLNRLKSDFLKLSPLQRSAVVFWSVGMPLIAIALIISPLLQGCASKPPTAFERSLYDITTNHTPVITVQTNVVPVVVYRTNEVTIPVTNAQNVVEYRTNTITVPQTNYQSVTVPVTNDRESYTYVAGAGVKRIQDTGGAVGNIFGVGGLVSTGLGILAGLWGWVRSSKQGATAANLAQSIETMREFVKQLPNGTVYDNALTQWLQANQANAGVVDTVLSLLQKEVSNNDAQIAAQQIRAIIAQLNPSAITPAPPKV